MDEECIHELIYIGQNKYRYMHETFDAMFIGSWIFNIKRYCRLFHHFKIFRDELEIIVNNFNKETKRILLSKKFCFDITNVIILYV